MPSGPAPANLMAGEREGKWGVGNQGGSCVLGEEAAC